MLGTMTSGHDATSHDDHDHDAHGHDDHGHDDHGDHGSGGDSWVLIPIGLGFVIGLIIAVSYGLGSGVSPF
jgi:hypothetical protein